MVEWALIAAPIHYGQSDLRDKALMLGDIFKAASWAAVGSGAVWTRSKDQGGVVL
jgi:hypothetical protein